MSKQDDNFDEFLKGADARAEQERDAFTRLLDMQREKAGHSFAMKCRMGVTDSYITAVSLSWVESNIQFAGDLPLFEGYADPGTKKIKINENTIELLQQREPNWQRQLQMSVYLAERDNHKFPPLLVVCYQNWVYKDRNESDNWNEEDKAIKSSIPAVELDSNGYFLDIEKEGTNYYALDGQHRLMAIKGLKELLDRGKLSPRDKNNNPKAKGEVDLDNIVESIIKRRQNYGVGSTNKTEIREELQNRLLETIGIEIIPAIQTGETKKEAVTRLRQIFVDVNEQAKSPAKGDAITLDSSNGFRIVARRIMVSHTLLEGSKTSQTKSQLSEKSESYTTLQGLVDIAQSYLKETLFGHWENPILGKKDFGYIRPSEAELEYGISEVTKYIDALSKLPSHKRFIQTKEEDRWKLRAKAESDDPNPLLVDNILFRPVAQSALAGAIGEILKTDEIPPANYKERLDDIITKLSKQEKQGMLQLRNRCSPWFGVLCDSDEKMRRHAQYQTLCQRLFFYLLSGVDVKELEKLREDFADARKTIDNKGINMDGEEVLLKDIHLPNPWWE